MNADQKPNQVEEYKKVVGTHRVLLIFISVSAVNPLLRQWRLRDSYAFACS
jgi:hypothetical protein